MKSRSAACIDAACNTVLIVLGSQFVRASGSFTHFGFVPLWAGFFLIVLSAFKIYRTDWKRVLHG